MKKTYYIKNSRPRLPVWSTIVIYLLMDKLNANDMAWGIVGTVCAIVWIICIIAVVNSKGIDIFEKENEKPVKKSFQEKINEAIKERQSVN